ncbi:heme exporter protein CcmD [Beggiatoa leptomitoformis]|uniref:Heme exporter protein D n=1 Tax=Beggiatoa leptomitoformis TaxID=288004 RepID=A0A2N9YHK8_9GAMM|nr:heme exporter protein CcmD [Beggiatoa leptomitoformis]ALG67740.1 heme exporter protein CcmD [Beggiatoa leptomitoformis]AUI70018.1 heme exporter protein CcmD [Beggiatoa leptomitoformis]
MNDFFNMGGYAFYVWTSYGLAFLILGANLLIPLSHKRELLQTLARRARRKENG